MDQLKDSFFPPELLKDNAGLCNLIKYSLCKGEYEETKVLLTIYNWDEVTPKFLENWTALNKLLHRYLTIQFEKTLQILLEEYYEAIEEEGVQVGSLSDIQAYLTENGRPNTYQIDDIARRANKPFEEIRDILHDSDIPLHDDLIAKYRNPISYLFKN